MTKRIVITGLGVVSALGSSIASFQKNLLDGSCGIRTVAFPLRDQIYQFPVAPVIDFSPDAYIEPKKMGALDRIAQFAIGASQQAYNDARLSPSESERKRICVITGTGAGGQNTTEESYMRLVGTVPSARLHPLTIPRLMGSAATSHISMHLGAKGPSFTVMSACASSLHAMSTAITYLRAGLADIAITGGAEACITLGTLKGWEALRVMSPDLCRPFSRDRSGMIIGEGAAMFVLESFEHASARGATIHAEILGCGMSSDASDLTSPDPSGAAEALRLALKDANLAIESIDYINAHGTGTRVNDISETAAIKSVFGSHAKRLAISSSKAQFGHALGASGALETLATIVALKTACVPPTINYREPDPECDLDYTPNTSRSRSLTYALNNSFAFGGLNAVLALKRADSPH